MFRLFTAVTLALLGSANGQITDVTTTITPVTGTGGDPHVFRWGGEKYSYHGQCDLVLLSSPTFGDGLGLDVHVRTTVESFFSYIEATAMKVGEHVINVNGDGFWLDHHQVTNFPTAEGRLQIEQYFQSNKALIMYHILLDGEKFMEIKVPANKYIFVRPMLTGEHTVAGLMGKYPTGELIGRDGVTEFVDTNEYGEEWQVKPFEDMMFLDSRNIGKCTYPDKNAWAASRKLRSKDLNEKAIAACAHVDAEIASFCIEDVMATGDVGIADGY